MDSYRKQLLQQASETSKNPPREYTLNSYATLGVFFLLYILMRNLRDIVRVDTRTLSRCLAVLCVAAVLCNAIFNVFIGMLVYCAIFAALYYQLPRPLLTVERRAVLITGCDTGIIGFSLACHLDKLGFQVFAGCASLDGNGAKELKSQASERLKTIALDVVNADDISEAVDFVMENLEDGVYLWGVVNTVSIVHVAEFEMFPLKHLQQEFELNTMGQIRVCKEFIPLIRQIGGRFINFTYAGNFITQGTAAYTMSQHAIEGFSDVLRLEMKKWGVGVSVIKPPLRETDLISKSEQENFQQFILEEVTEDQRELYGDDYFNNMVEETFARLAPSVSMVDLSTIADSVTDALLSLKPKSKYQCGMMYTLYGILSLLPGVITDRISAYLTPQNNMNIAALNVKSKDQ